MSKSCLGITILIILVVILFGIILWLDAWKKHGPLHDYKKSVRPRALEPWGGWARSVNEEYGWITAGLFLVFGVLRWIAPTFLLVRARSQSILIGDAGTTKPIKAFRGGMTQRTGYRCWF